MSKNNNFSLLVSSQPYKIVDQVKEYLYWCQYFRGFTFQTCQSKYYELRMFTKHMVRYYGVFDMADFSNEHLNRWIVDVRVGKWTGRECSYATCRKYQVTIIAFIKFLEEARICNTKVIPAYIMNIKRDHKIPVYFSRDNIDKVLSMSDVMQKALIKTKFESGMRLFELQQIRISDIDFANRSIRVVGKGSKPATVYLTFGAIFVLNDYIKSIGLTKDDYLWRSERNGGKPYTRNSLRNMMADAFKKAGYSEFHPHSLRHSFAIDAHINGATIEEIKIMLRHENISTTQRYLEGLLNVAQEIFNKVKREGIYSVNMPELIKS